MLKIENTEVMGWEHAIRGMRNPKNSWEKSDSGVCATHGPAHCADCVYTDCHADDVEIGTKYILGPNDLNLMTTLRNAGTDHRKFMRMITVYLDITAPLYWWKEFDTYKVSTVANSTSTMLHDAQNCSEGVYTGGLQPRAFAGGLCSCARNGYSYLECPSRLV